MDLTLKDYKTILDYYKIKYDKMEKKKYNNYSRRHTCY